jgi:hypothetical protein
MVGNLSKKLTDEEQIRAAKSTAAALLIARRLAAPKNIANSRALCDHTFSSTGSQAGTRELLCGGEEAPGWS